MNIDNDYISEQLRRICIIFGIAGSYVGYDVITNGNINNTYKVYFDCSGTEKKYLLQRVNTYVFKKPEDIMSNIDKITTHIGKKTGKTYLHFHHVKIGTYKGLNYFYDDETDGSFWRLSTYIDSVTYDVCESAEQLEAAGRAFGEFQTALSDFDASSLKETIMDFHNTPKRIAAFLEDAELDFCGRSGGVASEIAFVLDMREAASYLVNRASQGKLPYRVTHNDTKINNVLFSIEDTAKPITVIDLDTVMPGIAMYDFGDAVRSAACTTDEDETDLSKVALDLDKYRAFARGYISETRSSLTREELSSMALGAISITVELGVRFLDDYIRGDKYFKITRPLQNLDRARCQFALVKDMLEKYDEMNAVISYITGDCNFSEYVSLLSDIRNLTSVNN